LLYGHTHISVTGCPALSAILLGSFTALVSGHLAEQLFYTDWPRTNAQRKGDEAICRKAMGDKYSQPSTCQGLCARERSFDCSQTFFMKRWLLARILLQGSRERLRVRPPCPWVERRDLFALHDAACSAALHCYTYTDRRTEQNRRPGKVTWVGSAACDFVSAAT
jgi:hypothetical protein